MAALLFVSLPGCAASRSSPAAVQGSVSPRRGGSSTEQELAAAATKVGAIAVHGDASNPADLERLYDTVRADGRQLDVLVANVGNAE